MKKIKEILDELSTMIGKFDIRILLEDLWLLDNAYKIIQRDKRKLKSKDVLKERREFLVGSIIFRGFIPQSGEEITKRAEDIVNRYYAFIKNKEIKNIKALWDLINRYDKMKIKK